MYRIIEILVVLLNAPRVIRAYANGAPAIACTTMTPGHGYTAGTSPYALAVSQTTYSAGSIVTVTVTGGAYQGLILQARLADGSSTDPVGTFSNFPSETRARTCITTDDTATHSSMVEKNGVSYTWTAPGSDAGTLRFKATVAQAMNVWWKDILSSDVTFGEDDASTANTNTNPDTNPTAQSPTSTGPVNGNTEGNSDTSTAVANPGDTTTSARIRSTATETPGTVTAPGTLAPTWTQFPVKTPYPTPPYTTRPDYSRNSTRAATLDPYYGQSDATGIHLSWSLLPVLSLVTYRQMAQAFTAMWT